MTAASNYPPGVTGAEWRIGGGDWLLVTVVCAACGAEWEGDLEVDAHGEYATECPDCGAVNIDTLEDQ